MDKRRPCQTFPKRNTPVTDKWAEAADRTRVGANIRKLRLGCGWTQSKLGEMMGYEDEHVGRMMVSQLERRVAWPKATTLQRLADAFAIPIDQLICTLMGLDEED